MAANPPMSGAPGGRVTESSPSAGLQTASAAGRLADLPAWVTLIRAPNPGPMTLDGTNTWVLRAPSGDAIVVDPGPLDEGHLIQVAATGDIRTIVATHHHPDHT